MMTGLEKIITEIGDEAVQEATNVVETAKAQAANILAQSKAESDAKVAKIEAASATDVADIERSRVSALQLQRRQKALETKQEILAQTLQKALDALYALPADAYFDLLVKLAATAAEQSEGLMLLGDKDRKRMPEGFEKKLAAALPKGAALKVAEQTRPIGGGFVLKYGDVEENCSFEALFDERREEFGDTVRDMLFA